MADDPLFPGFDPPPPPDAEPGLSQHRRLTLRQSADIGRGVHPLTHTKVHPLADPDPAPTDPRGLPYRCGSCVWRVVLGYHDRSYPKCLCPGGEHESGTPRVTHGAASDVRAWWPACPDYSPGDTGVSPDAARFIPGEDTR